MELNKTSNRIGCVERKKKVKVKVNFVLVTIFIPALKLNTLFRFERWNYEKSICYRRKAKSSLMWPVYEWLSTAGMSSLVISEEGEGSEFRLKKKDFFQESLLGRARSRLFGTQMATMLKELERKMSSNRKAIKIEISQTNTREDFFFNSFDSISALLFYFHQYLISLFFYECHNNRVGEQSQLHNIVQDMNGRVIE